MPNWVYILSLVVQLHVLLPGVYLVIAQNNSKGRAFVVTFLPDFSRFARNSIVVTTDADTTVFIYNALTGNHTRHLVSGNSSLQVTFPREVSIITNLIIEKKAIIVHATHPVSVYAISSQNWSKSSYLVLPIEKWGDKYIIATYGTPNEKGGEFVILAAEDNTHLTIELNFIGWIICKNGITLVEPLKLSKTLQRWELYRLACNNDLTGSTVKGTHPFGIISGNQCTKISTNDSKYCDQIAEMMIPSNMLGADYIISPVANRRSKLRIIYNYNDSEIKSDTFVPFQVNYTVSSGLNVSYLFKNRLFQEIYLDPNTTIHVKTNRSVMVILYSSMSGDAAMTVIPSVDRFDSEYNLFFNWQKLQGSDKEFLTDIDIYTPSGQTLYGIGGFNISARSAFNFTTIYAKSVGGTFLSNRTFPSASDIIVKVSGGLSSMTFTAGMKIDLYTGEDNCSSNPCKNNGACYTIGHDLRCFCGDQLDGNFCQTDIFNSCQSQPCQNGGTCQDEVFDFTCNCSVNFTGKMCEFVLTTTTGPTTKTSTTTVTNSTSLPTSSTTHKTSTKSALSTAKSTTTTLSSTTTKSVTSTLSSTKSITSTLSTTKSITSTLSSTNSITSTPSTTKRTKPQESKICNCTCDNVTLETIVKTKKEIEKELKVDPKTVHKTITKYESTYDERPSAAGIGIMGILFLSLLFGSVALLDMLSAGHFILTKFLHWRERKKLGKNTSKTSNGKKAERIQVSEMIMTNKPANNTCTRRNMSKPIKPIVLPRFKVDENGSVVVDVENSDFVYEKFSSLSQNEMSDLVFDFVFNDKNKFVHDGSDKMYHALDDRKVDNSLSGLSYFEEKENKSCMDNLLVRELSKNDVNDFNKIDNSFHLTDNSVSDSKIINEQLSEIKTEDDCVSVEMNDLFLNIPPDELLTTDPNVHSQCSS